MTGDTGSARHEAERLVASLLAMAARNGLGGTGRGRADDPGTGARRTDGIGALGDTLAGLVGQWTGTPGGHGFRPGATSPHAGGSTGGWSTGSAECCVCPICRLIASLRDPTPEAAERLATGAGDLATGVASMLRALSALSGDRPRRPQPGHPSRPAPDPGTTWSFATRATGQPDEAGERPPAPDPATTDAWSAATRTTPEPATRTRPAQTGSTQTGPTQAGPAQAGPTQAGAPRPAAPTRADRPPAPPRPGTDPWAAATAATPASAAPGGVTSSSPGACAPTGGRGPESAVGAGNPRTGENPALPGPAAGGGRTARGGDAPAAGVADVHLAEPSAVDHDDPDPAADAGPAGTGSAPAAAAAGDSDEGTGDGARAGAAG
jgi:hypothetical protein